MNKTIWDVLGIEETLDSHAIKVAYSKQESLIEEDDTERLQILKSAYGIAIRAALAEEYKNNNTSNPRKSFVIYFLVLSILTAFSCRIILHGGFFYIYQAISIVLIYFIISKLYKHSQISTESLTPSLPPLRDFVVVVVVTQLPVTIISFLLSLNKIPFFVVSPTQAILFSFILFVIINGLVLFIYYKYWFYKNQSN